MQCQSYLPLYYAHGDLNVDANSSTKPVYTGHAKPPTDLFNQRVLNLHVTEGYHPGYDKEFLRQTILQQEVTFKDQVQELHRLYRRQRELLDEIKKTNVYKKNVISEVQWPANLSTSNVSFSSDQKGACSISFDSLAFSPHSSAFGANITETPWMSTKGENIATALHASKNVKSSNILDLSLSQCNVSQRKPLDLQLSADEYINKEGKVLNSFDVSQMSVLSTHTSNRACSLAPLGACSLAPLGNTKPFYPSSSPTTFSSHMIDLANFSGSKTMHSVTLSDCPDKKKMKMCRDFIETAWQPRGEDVGRIRSNVNTSGFYLYSESLQRLAEAGQGHQITPLFTKKLGQLENGRRNTDAKVSGSIHEMLNLNTPGHTGAFHRSILEFPAAHSSKVVPLFSPKFSATASQAPFVDELDYSSRCGTILEKGRSLQASRSDSNVKASSASSGFLFQSYKCHLASTDNESGKQTNRLDSIDLNCNEVAGLGGFSANSIVPRDKLDDLSLSELVSSQVSSPSRVVLKENHMGASELQHVTVTLDHSACNEIHDSCEETALRSCTNVEQEPTGLNKKSKLFDINLPCQLTTDMASLEDDPVGDVIQLETNVKDDKVSPRKDTNVDLEVSMMPISPEKQECPRRREDGESTDEVMKIAADVLVSISSSNAQQSLSDSDQCQSSSNDLFIWFADIVCSIENCEKASSSCTGIDYFEAMTLKLSDASEEDYRCNNSLRLLYSEKEICDAPSSAESSRGSRTKRVKRKNFQREVLPCLATLSRYEVCEDIQVIERLMETVGTPLKMGAKTRKVVGRRRLKGKKKIATPCSLETRTWLLALPHMGKAANDLKDEGCVKWENMHRQPRGPRCPTVFPNMSLSQEGWMRKWGVSKMNQKTCVTSD